MNKSLEIRFIILLLITVCTSCLSPRHREGKATFFSFTDCYGRTVDIDSVPRRIISLSPSVTEMIFMLQSENLLVGISDFCHYPAATDTMHRVGGLQNVNIESLMACRPDVVIIGSIVSRQDVEKMENAGLKVLILREETRLEGLCDALSTLGKLLNREELAERKVDSVNKELALVRQSVDTGVAARKVYYVVGFGEEGDFTAPSGSHIDEIITCAGGINVGKTLTNWSVSREYLFESDPDIIIVRKEDLDAFIHTRPYTMLTAVRKGKVYPIDSGWIDIVSPRNVEAVKYINNLLK